MEFNNPVLDRLEALERAIEDLATITTKAILDQQSLAALALTFDLADGKPPRPLLKELQIRTGESFLAELRSLRERMRGAQPSAVFDGMEKLAVAWMNSEPPEKPPYLRLVPDPE